MSSRILIQLLRGLALCVLLDVIYALVPLTIDFGTEAATAVD